MSSASSRSRFSRRVFLAVAASLLVVSTAFTTYFVHAQREQLEAALADRGRLLGGLLATGARTAVYAESAELVQDILSSIVGRRDMLSAAVFTLDGELVAADGRTPRLREEAGRLDAGDLDIVRRLGAERGCLNHWDVETIDGYCPVLLGEGMASAEDLYFDDQRRTSGWTAIGFIKVTLDRLPVREEIRRMVLRSMTMMAVILLLGGWAGLAFSRRVTSPLEQLTEAVRVYGAGGDVRDLSRMPDNEIGRLAEAFTTMTRDLAVRGREKEELAERLRHAQKMKAVGELSQGISHDFKNFLSTLKITTYLIERTAPDNQGVLKYAGRMNATIDRAQQLVERLLLFSRTGQLQMVDVDLGALLAQLAPAVRMVLGDQVRLDLEPLGCPVPVRGDPARLEQLLMNLVYNARDAMPGVGALGVRLGIRAGSAGEPAMARLSVADTGVGMPPEVRERVFESFFTTKGSGSGLGLGLSIVRGIVEEHGGRVEVESVPGEGTTFHVELPLSEQAARPPAEHAAG